MSSAYASTALVPYNGTISGSHVGHEQHGQYGHNRIGRSGVADEEILALRRERVRVNDIAARLGVTTNTVCNVLKKHGMTGKQWRAPNNRKVHGHTKRDPLAALEDAIHEYGGIYIESADLPNGRDGFLVTIGNEFPGMACTSIGAALRSAIAALGDRECARGGRA